MFIESQHLWRQGVPAKTSLESSNTKFSHRTCCYIFFRDLITFVEHCAGVRCLNFITQRYPNQVEKQFFHQRFFGTQFLQKNQIKTKIIGYQKTFGEKIAFST